MRNVRFDVVGVEIERETTFKYLGRVISDDNNDTVVIETNFKKAFKKLLMRESACLEVMGNFYKGIVQSVHLYGSESWVLTPKPLRMLRTFHPASLTDDSLFGGTWTSLQQIKLCRTEGIRCVFSEP